MLYDGAIRFMELGKRAIVAQNLEQQNYNLQKAQRIVTELMATLDMHKGGDVARNLFALYSYVQNELVTANVEDRPQPVDNALNTMRQLREGWAELEKQLRTTGGEPILNAA